MLSGFCVWCLSWRNGGFTYSLLFFKVKTNLMFKFGMMGWNGSQPWMTGCPQEYLGTTLHSSIWQGLDSTQWSAGGHQRCWRPGLHCSWGQKCFREGHQRFVLRQHQSAILRCSGSFGIFITILGGQSNFYSVLSLIMAFASKHHPKTNKYFSIRTRNHYPSTFGNLWSMRRWNSFAVMLPWMNKSVQNSSKMSSSS